MEVGVLGPLVVRRDRTDLTPRGQRPRDVLTVLLLRRGHSVAPEAILELVWGDEAFELSVAAVHTVVARLRRALGPDAIETLDDGYRVAAGVTTDAEAFTDLVRRAREATTAGNGPATVSLYRQALALWRGELAYAGVTDDLVVPDRARLDDLRSAAVEDLAECLLDGDGGADPVAAAQEAGELVTALARTHPLRERAHALAMLAAYRAGRQAEALEVYRVLALRLREELGVDPGPLATELHRRLLAQDPSLAAVAAEVPAGSVGAVSAVPLVSPARLPLPSSPTVGREDEVAAVVSALEAGRRVVTLVGPGGVGKSRILSEVGLAMPPDLDLTYIDLSGVGEADPEELAEAVAVAYGLGAEAGDAVGGLVTLLRCTTTLVLVDEAEATVGGVVVLVSALLEGCPGLRFVVTSRVPLGLAGERRVDVAPLPCPDADAGADEIASSPAVRLLLDRLRDHGLDPGTAEATGATLAAIARRVDGLPLALELVAGNAASSSLAELEALVDAPLDVTSDDAGLAPRHRTLRETIRWSVDRLAPEQRALLRRLGVFAGSFDAAAASAVVGIREVGPALRGLVRESLVQADRRGPQVRFRLLRTVRDLALDDLAEEGELASARRRHREWYAARWRDTPLEDALVADVGASYDDYLEALRDAVAVRDSTTAGDLLLTLCRRWQFIETSGPALRWIERVLAAGLLTPRQRGRILIARAGLQLQGSGVDDYSEAERLVSGDPDGLGLFWMVRCIERYLRADFDGAAEAAVVVLELGRTTASHHLPEGLASLAAVHAALEHPAEALATADEAWSLVSAAPTATHLVSVVPKIALALTDSGHPRRALDVLEAAMAGAGARLGVRPTHTMLVNAGWAALGCGEPEAALGWFARGLTDASALPQGYALAENLYGAGRALDLLGSSAAPEVLVAAQDLSERHALVLTAGQQQELDPSLAALPPRSAAVLPEPDHELAVRMTALVHGELVRRSAPAGAVG